MFLIFQVPSCDEKNMEDHVEGEIEISDIPVDDAVPLPADEDQDNT